MSLIKVIRAQLGLSSTPANNFTWDASADNGTAKLARGNAGATTQDILTVDANGRVAMPNNVVAFNVYPAGNQTVTVNTFTKVGFDTKRFDTTNAFDATTNYRFQPVVAGYYQMSACVGLNTTPAAGLTVQFRKNTEQIYCGQTLTSTYAISGSTVIYLNGSSDYVEVWCYISSGAGNVLNGGTTPNTTHFSGILIAKA